MKTKLFKPGSYRLRIQEASKYAGHERAFHVVIFDVLNADDTVEEQRQWVSKIGTPMDSDWDFLASRVGEIIYARVEPHEVFLKGRQEYVTLLVFRFYEVFQ